MRKAKFTKNDEELFKQLYKEQQKTIDAIAVILKTNSTTVRKYLKLWNLHDPNRSYHKNKTSGGWNKLRGFKVCKNCAWEGPCDRAHIVPRHKGGSYSSSNIIILCPNCHRLFDRGLIDLSHLLSPRSAGDGAE